MTNAKGEMTVFNVKQSKYDLAILRRAGHSTKTFSVSLCRNTTLEEPHETSRGSELELIQAVAQTLHLKTSDELRGAEAVLYPSILCSAVFKGSLETLETMKNEFGADLAAADYDKRTPLHVAASEGNVKVRQSPGVLLIIFGVPAYTPVGTTFFAKRKHFAISQPILVSLGAHHRWRH